MDTLDRDSQKRGTNIICIIFWIFYKLLIFIVNFWLLIHQLKPNKVLCSYKV